MISLVTNYLRQAVHLSFVAFYSRKINKKKSIILSHFSTLKFLFGPKKPTKTYYKELCRVSCTFPAINNAYLTAFHANVSIRFFLRCFYTLHAGTEMTPISSLFSRSWYFWPSDKRLNSADVKWTEQITECLDAVQFSRLTFTKAIHFRLLFLASGLWSPKNGIWWIEMPLFSFFVLLHP